MLVRRGDILGAAMIQKPSRMSIVDLCLYTIPPVATSLLKYLHSGRILKPNIGLGNTAFQVYFTKKNYLYELGGLESIGQSTLTWISVNNRIDNSQNLHANK